MTTINSIQTALETAYEGLTLPNGLGSPTVYEWQDDPNMTAPAIVITRGTSPSNTPIASDRRLIVREFIVDLFAYAVDNSDSLFLTQRANTADCIDTIEQAFSLYGLDADFVVTNRITADTGDVELYATQTNKNYIGVRFRHEVTYWQL
jgi:hypothetical protein